MTALRKIAMLSMRAYEQLSMCRWTANLCLNEFPISVPHMPTADLWSRDTCKRPHPPVLLPCLSWPKSSVHEGRYRERGKYATIHQTAKVPIESAGNQSLSWKRLCNIRSRSPVRPATQEKYLHSRAWPHPQQAVHLPLPQAVVSSAKS